MAGAGIPTSLCQSYMAENDIYNSEQRYKKIKGNIDAYLAPPTGRRKFQIRYAANLRYIKRLFLRLEAQDNSYIRRVRLLRSALLICHYAQMDLQEMGRDDIDYIMRKALLHNRSNESKRTFVLDVRYIWRLLFPDSDAQGREDDTVVPYVVRHLRTKLDKSTQKLRTDRISWEEYQRLLKAFADDIRMQALISLAVESLGRPQELLGRKIKDVQLFDNYAKVVISERGKEGVGVLRCIDSYYYMSRWLNEHPRKDDPEAYVFINLGQTHRYRQMKPTGANKLIRHRCVQIGLQKRITLYSLKRNGVTFCRLRGDSDVDIQHRARWTSTKQLRTYDLSHHDDSFKRELIRRGLIQAEEGQGELTERTRTCVFCHAVNGLVESSCHRCHRPLDRARVEQAIQEEGPTPQKVQDQLQEMRACMQQMMEREEKRADYDALLNTVVAMPEFKTLWARAKEKEKAERIG